MEREYAVAAEETKYTAPDGKVYETGGTFKTDKPLAHEKALVAGGVLKLLASAKYDCPACAEHGKKKPPKFATTDELAAHYAKDHPGLVPPTEEG